MKKNYIARHLQNFSDIFKYHEKDEEAKREAFYSFSDEAMNRESNLYPYYDVISDTMRELQTDEDTRYREAKNCIDWIIENYEENHTIADIEDYEVSEAIESNVDVYTNSLTEWLNKSNYNVYYLTTALESGDVKDGFQALTLAQYYCYEEIYNSVRDTVLKFIKENN